ncbi:MAG: tetratricopeptide repeat protein [Muribaculum sp.]|nr:tetratricopeptide repeat protein [Muribaculum sp.]
MTPHSLNNITKTLAAMAMWMVSVPLFSQTPGSPPLLSPLTSGYMARADLFSQTGLPQGVADQLQRIFTQGSRLSTDERREVLFLLGQAYSRTGNPQCMDLLREYTIFYPASPDAPDARLAMADFLFYAGKYSDALEAFNDVDLNRIDPSLKPEATYHKAFAMLKCGFFDEAKPLLADLADNPVYSRGALFCEAYADYMLHDYETAFAKFSEVKRSSGTEETDPALQTDYYLAQIHYGRGEYEEAADMAEGLLHDNPVPLLEEDTERVAGLARFKLNETESARRHLSKYIGATGENALPDAKYAYATLLYEDDDIEGARSLFEEVSRAEDAIAQGALLYLGQIAAPDDDNAAAMYFEKASRMGFDRDVSRKALYNYVAARTRGGRIPFAPQIDLLERFLREYPSSDKTPQVREYLASAYYHEKDYANALQSINGISNPDKKINGIKQRILYELGVREMQNGKTAEAQNHLLQAVNLGNLNKGLLPEARLWLGDAYYAASDFAKASAQYSKALKDLSGSNKALALYNNGYTLLQLKKYREAAEAFRRASQDQALDSRLRQDARVRLADCLFYSGDNAGARSLYASLSAEGVGDKDYTAWRHAVITGVLGDTKGKITELEQLRTKAGSRWMPDILSELGDAYASAGQSSRAEKIYTEILSDYPDNRNAPATALSLAKTYAKNGSADKAESQYRQILSSWPTSAQATEADGELRRIYASQGKLREYSDFLASIPGGIRLNTAEMEELAFDAAADAFNEDEKAIELTEAYLKQFPDGENASEARYNLARGYEARGNTANALKAWKDLEQSGDNRYLPSAWAGIMRTAPEASVRLKYSRMVSESPGISAEDREEARLIQAEALMATGKGTEAETILRQLSATPATEAGAEAAVILGEYYIKDGKPAKAESLLTAFVDSGTPHMYWLARGYIALADAYSAMGRKDLARQYLESLRENYPGDEADIRKMIQSRLK